MADSTRMTYDCSLSARVYQEWHPHGLHHVLVEHVNFEFFGDLTGKRIVEFGCGDGSFLRKCLAKGASSCLGFDVNEAMISAGMKKAKDSLIANHLSGAGGQIRFMVRDCFKPIDDVHERFDFAVGQFLLHECSKETGLRSFIKNVLRMLKPGGKLFIGQCPYVTTTLRDQEVIANLCGYLHPTKDEAAGRDPFFARVPAFYPASTAVFETGRPFTRRKMFTFTDNYWSKETVMSELEKGEFVNVEFLPQKFPDSVPLFEATQMKALDEPVILIGAEAANE